MPRATPAGDAKTAKARRPRAKKTVSVGGDVRLTGDRLVVKLPENGERKSASGLLIPATAAPAPKRLAWADVQLIGPDVRVAKRGIGCCSSRRRASKSSWTGRSWSCSGSATSRQCPRRRPVGNGPTGPPASTSSRPRSSGGPASRRCPGWDRSPPPTATCRAGAGRPRREARGKGSRTPGGDGPRRDPRIHGGASSDPPAGGAVPAASSRSRSEPLPVSISARPAVA